MKYVELGPCREQILLKILSIIPDINHKDRLGYTVLHIASGRHDPLTTKMWQLLIDKGAKINTNNA